MQYDLLRSPRDLGWLDLKSNFGTDFPKSKVLYYVVCGIHGLPHLDEKSTMVAKELLYRKRS